MSRRLNILGIMFKIIAFFITTLFTVLHVRVSILLTCGKHMHDPIIQLWGEVWAHKTSFNPTTFHWTPCSMTGKWLVMHMCAMGINLASFYDFSIGVWNCYDSMVFFLFFISLLNSICPIKKENALSKSFLLRNWHPMQEVWT